MERGSFKGEMSEIVWDEDGDMLRLPTRPATWSPPVETSSHTHRSFLAMQHIEPKLVAFSVVF